MTLTGVVDFYDGQAGIERYVARGILEDLEKDFPGISTNFENFSESKAYPTLMSPNYNPNSAPIVPKGADAGFRNLKISACLKIRKIDKAIRKNASGRFGVFRRRSHFCRNLSEKFIPGC